MKYLAYGANMDAEIIFSRCADAKFLGTGILVGYRLLFKGEEPSAYATIEPWDNYRVPYVLWEISANDERSLDDWEGYPSFYGKQVVSVEFGNEKFLAMFYQKDEKQPVGQPMTHYIEVLESAYKKFGFDRSILDDAIKFSNDFFQRRFV